MKKDWMNQLKKNWFLYVCIFFIVAAAALLVLYINNMSQTATQFTQGYMKELAEHDMLNISDKLKGYKESLLEVAETIRLQKVDNLENAQALLRLKRESNNLKNMFLIDSDGMSYSYNNVVTDESDKDYVQSVVERREEYLAKPDIASIWYDWNNSLRYSVPIDPIVLDGKKMVGICGEYPFELIGTSLQLNSFGNEGVSTLIDQNGNVLSQTGIITQKPIDNNFFKELKENYKVTGKGSAESVADNLNNMKPVNFQYERDGVEYLCLSIPHPDLRLTLISTVPVEIARMQYNQMLRLTLLTVFIIAVIIVALGAGLYWTYKDSILLKIQKNTAEAVASSKSMFLSNMSHEIRTPLNAIIGFSELLSKSRQLSEQDKEQIQKIEVSSHFLLSLINDILDMSRIDNGKMELICEPIELDSLINNINSIFAGQAQQRKITYSSDNNCQGLYINGDVTRIQQILMNLLGNSLKFTSEGGKIHLKTECLREDDKSVRVSFIVSDTGCGMSKEFLNQFFMPFTQEYNKNAKKQTGTGLGLSICYEMTKLMGGTIQVKSELGEGSCFMVDIPFEKAEQQESTAVSTVMPKQVDWSSVTILVAEDNELNMEILISLLEMRQVKTVQAFNGQEAYELFLESNPGKISMILMDMQMPVMDGLEAAERIRTSAHPCAKTIPILAVTANAFISDMERAFAHGMNAYITKPIDPEQLFLKLYEYLFKEEK